MKHCLGIRRVVPWMIFSFCCPFHSFGESEASGSEVIQVGTCADNNPFEFYSTAATPQLTGFDIELAEAVANHLKVSIVFQDMRFNGIIPALQTDTIQWAIASIAPSEARRQQASFSIPYLKDQAVLVSLKNKKVKNFQTLQAGSMGVQLGTSHESYARTLLPEHIQLKSYPRVQEMVQDLSLSRIQAILIGESEARKIISLKTNLTYVPLPWSDDKAFAFPKKSVWTEKVNQALKALEANGHLESLQKKWKVGPFEELEAQPQGLFQFKKILPSLGYLSKGFLVTLRYVALALFFGIIIGICLVACKLSHVKSLRWFASIYTSVFRGTPLLLQLTLVYYAFPQVSGFQLSAFQAGILAFSLNSAAYVSEILRSGFNGIGRGQWEAAKVLGIPKIKLWKDIVLPQAFKNSLPALANEMIDLLKESALISVIGEADLLCRANQIASESYLFFEPLLLAALFYYVTVLGLSSFVKFLEKRFQCYASH